MVYQDMGVSLIPASHLPILFQQWSILLLHPGFSNSLSVGATALLNRPDGPSVEPICDGELVLIQHGDIYPAAPAVHHLHIHSPRRLRCSFWPEALVP